MMVGIDLFSGAGGLTEGFVRQGFKFAAHIEKDYWACKTLETRLMYHFLKRNGELDLYFNYYKTKDDAEANTEVMNQISNRHPGLVQMISKEVLNKSFGNPTIDENATSLDELIKLVEDSLHVNNLNDVDIIIGGPPCQAYSLVGRSRMRDRVLEDDRNYLFRYYRDIVNHFKPKIFVFENVPGLHSSMNGKIFEEIFKEFDRIGYHLSAGREKENNKAIVNAMDYGVHQTRKRVILFGSKKELNAEYPDFQRYKVETKNPITTKNAISDLPALSAGMGSDFGFTPYEVEENLSDYQKDLRGSCEGVINHKARNHSSRDLMIYKIAINHAEKGKRIRYCDLPTELKTHKNEKSFLDRYKVHFSDGVPHTIVAHISKDGHYNIHPDIEQCRSLTVREAARIQSFPDDYIFEGPRTPQYIQVGNAVPPMMAEAIAKTIKEDFFKG